MPGLHVSSCTALLSFPEGRLERRTVWRTTFRRNKKFKEKRKKNIGRPGESINKATIVGQVSRETSQNGARAIRNGLTVAGGECSLRFG